jgi:hypothetical protein
MWRIKELATEYDNGVTVYHGRARPRRFFWFVAQTPRIELGDISLAGGALSLPSALPRVVAWVRGIAEVRRGSGR